MTGRQTVVAPVVRTRTCDTAARTPRIPGDGGARERPASCVRQRRGGGHGIHRRGDGRDIPRISRRGFRGLKLAGERRHAEQASVSAERTVGTTCPGATGSCAAQSGLRWAFQTPTGNIGCLLDGTVTPATVSCVIREHTYEAQESLSPVCAPASPLRFEMTEGQSPSVGCVARSEGFGLPVQDYGQPISAGSIRCVSDIVSGVTCTDRRSGHFFQVAREAFTAG